MRVTFRPLSENEARVEHHERSRFESGWSQTLSLLSYELGKLGAEAVVIKLALESKDIRLDGWPRANASPSRPDVVVEWQMGSQWSRMAATKYDHWQDNVRAVALTLEALRAVERWGAVQGEQYEGLRLELEGPSANSASALLDSYGGLKEALKATHPDRGGDPEEFRRVQEARDVLRGW